MRLAALKPKKFFSIKIHIRDELESEDYKLTRFPFARFDDHSLCLQSQMKGATCSKTGRWLLGERSSRFVIQQILSMLLSKVGFLFAQTNAKQGEPSPLLMRSNNMLWRQKRTQLPILNIDFATENKHKHSVMGVFVTILTWTLQTSNRLGRS